MNNREEFLAQRRLGIGGSDIGVIMEANKYKSELQLYLEKIGEAEPFTGNRFTKWGQLLEPVILESYRQLQEIPEDEFIVNAPGENRDELFIKLKSYPFLCHLDGIVYPLDIKKYILEAKTASTYRSDDFGQEGSDDIPEEYLFQCQWNMALAGVAQCHIPILLGGNDERVYVAYRNNDLIKILQERASDWWDKHIIDAVEPEVGSSKSDLDLLRKKYLIDSGEIMIVQREDPIFPSIENFYAARKAIAQIQPKYDKAKNQLIQHMKSVSILEYPGGRFTYKKDRDGKPKGNWEAIAQKMAERIANLTYEIEANTIDPEDIIQVFLNDEAYVVPGRRGSRKFLPKPNRD